MSIYTKGGDKGNTSTFSGKRISKSSKLIEAIGSVDELNSFLGIIRSHYHNSNYGSDDRKIENVQKNLFTINAILSGAKLKFPSEAVIVLEKEIDAIEKKLPKQKNFIFYGGSQIASELFFARAICRRSERTLPGLKIVNCKLEILTYINRLSDYLYIKGKEANFRSGEKEIIWRNSQ